MQRPCHGLANPDVRNIVRVSEGNCTLTNPVEANCRVLVPTSSRLWVQNPEKVLLPFVLFISPQGQGTQCIASVGPCQGSFIFAGSFLYALCLCITTPEAGAACARATEEQLHVQVQGQVQVQVHANVQGSAWQQQCARRCAAASKPWLAAILSCRFAYR